MTKAIGRIAPTIRALEQIGPEARSQLPTIKRATDSPYEFTRRYARRLVRNLGMDGRGGR